MSGLKIFLCAFVVATPLTVDAKPLYVNSTTGSDATTYSANGPSTPWATIGRAAWGSTNRPSPDASQAAQAGDTVFVQAGTYTTTGTGTRFTPAYNPINNGTATNPIIFEAQGAVVLRLSSLTGPVIGAYQRNYITWRGFTINEANAFSHMDTGPVVLWHTVGSRIENSTITGRGASFQPPDNHPGIRLEFATGVTVRNNTISGFHVLPGHLGGVNTSNGAGIQVYFSDGFVLENNEVFDCGSGIFLKGLFADQATNGFDWAPTADMIVRYNNVHDVASGIIAHVAPATIADPIWIYQNIVRNVSNIGIRIWPFPQTTRQVRHVRVINNTVYAAGVTGMSVEFDLIANAGIIFWNNIVKNSNVGIGYANQSNLTTDRFNSEHNVVHGNSTNLQAGGATFSLGSWQATFNQDVSAPPSVTSDPLFVNAATGDFRLQAGSSALNRGVDMLDLDDDGNTVDLIPAGAYVTGTEIIGLFTPGTIPARVLGLRVTP